MARWPKPRVYPTKSALLKAHGADFYFVRPMEPAGSMFGIRLPDGTYNWYDWDQHRGGWVLRATSRRAGPSQIYPAEMAEQQEQAELSGLGQIASPGDTARTINRDTVPYVMAPPGHEWVATGPAPGGGFNWKVVPLEDSDRAGKFPWALVIGGGLIALVLGIVPKGR